MLWIYGGGFLQGVSSVFNASGIIAQSVLRVRPILILALHYGATDSALRRGHLSYMSASTTAWDRLAFLKAPRLTRVTR